MLYKFIDLDYNKVITNEDKEKKLKYSLTRFPCGEYAFRIEEDINNYNINIYQKFFVGSFNDDLIKLQIVCNVLKKHNIKKINYFAPFLPYTRQDKDNNKNISFGLKLLVEIINNCNIKQIETYDIHKQEKNDHFNCKIIKKSAIPLFIEKISCIFRLDEYIIIFPDVGANNRFYNFFKQKQYSIAILQKTRNEGKITIENKTEINYKKTAIIIDDIIDSGNTIYYSIQLLKKYNIKNIYIYATHGLFSGHAIEKLKNIEEIKKITITNSLHQNSNLLDDKFEIIDIG